MAKCKRTRQLVYRTEFITVGKYKGTNFGNGTLMEGVVLEHCMHESLSLIALEIIMPTIKK